jgi:hypothetical protein
MDYAINFAVLLEPLKKYGRYWGGLTTAKVYCWGLEAVLWSLSYDARRLLSVRKVH